MASNNTSAQVTTHDTYHHHVHVAKTLSPLFVDDPPVRFILSSLPEEARLAYMDDYFGTLVKAAALNSAEFVEANDWDCTAVWLPPGKRIDNPWTWWSAGFVGCLWKLGVAGCKRMMIDYQSASDKCKHQALAGMESYHYLFLVGTKVSARGRGLASQIIRKKQAQATKEGLPIWLEATTEGSRDVYKRCGFDVVGTFKLGQGHFASTGEKEDGGPGATIWAMLWKPEKDEDVMQGECLFDT